MLQIICPDGNKFAVMQLAEMIKSNLIDKLESLSNSPAEQVAIIKQTIQNGWTDFFPLKRNKEKGSGNNVSSWLEHEKIQSTGGVFGD